MKTTKIQWTESTWNPVVGCSKKSAGCQKCYAINQAYRMAAMAEGLEAKGKNSGSIGAYKGLTEKRGDRIEWTGIVRFVPEALEIPLKRKKSTVYFVNSMSDLGHQLVEDEWLDQIFAVMALTPQHQYQILTKRPNRLFEYIRDYTKEQIRIAACSLSENEIPEDLSVLPNVRIGISAENQKEWNERSPYLNAIAQMGWKTMVSFEPLLEAIAIEDFDIYAAQDAGFDSVGLNALFFGTDYLEDCWGIIGGESGNGAREHHCEWSESLLTQFESAGITPFEKQLGSNAFYKGDRLKTKDKKGGDIAEFPPSLQVRGFPR